MQFDRDCPLVLREFLSYHENIKAQSKKTISEYYLDLRMFLRFIVLIKNEMPYHTDLETISIRSVDTDLLRTVTVNDIYDFLSYLANDRVKNPDSMSKEIGIGSAARARKLSSIKSFYKYLTVRTRQLEENPVKDLEYPKLRKSLPRYLTLEQSRRLLEAVEGMNSQRDFAILMIFLTCGIRISELVGLNLSDVYDDRIRVVGKGNKERVVFLGTTCREAIDAYLPIRKKLVLTDDRALFGSRDHNRISVSAVHRLVKKHLLAAGLDASQFSAHKLRHTAATMMLSGGVDVKTVQEVLGHENLNTTQIYTHIENTELQIAARANPISQLKIEK
ncbi:MAG: recombinase XerC [Ruminococcaceae bacterium]|nr:recombinase XerC [Oscillospiraceae bacterium]